MNVQFTPRVLALLAAAAIGLVALVGWFGLVSPQRSKAETLEVKIAEEQEKLTVAQLLARSQRADKKKTTGVGLLTKAMPSTLQMPALLRQIQKLAETSNVDVQTFTPSGATPLAGYEAVPIDLSVTGRYAAVQGFLHRLRVHASSNGGRIQAAGRLFDVQTVGLAPGGVGAPELTATLRLAAFVYTGVPLPVVDATATETDSTAAGAAPEEGTS